LILKLVILDRDGTINADSDEYIKSPEEWMPLPGALDAIARLNHAGWRTVIASNQSGLGRGLFDVASLNAMHAKMHKMLAQGGRIDAVFYCPHSPDEGCQCRKPSPACSSRSGAIRVDLKGTPVVVTVAICRPASRPAVSRTWPDRQGRGCAAARYRTFPGRHRGARDLAAFADWLIARQASAKTVS
jgi:D-glycero-D-manno-heptose 1,7-bisphosphate phosphatase